MIVKDQGTAINPNSIDKIGTPFYTTKEVGTGLGLSTFYLLQIAARHNASIDLDTGPSGTTFYVTFSLH